MSQFLWQYGVRNVADITNRIGQIVNNIASTFGLRLGFRCFLHDYFLQMPVTAVNSYGGIILALLKYDRTARPVPSKASRLLAPAGVTGNHEVEDRILRSILRRG